MIHFKADLEDDCVHDVTVVEFIQRVWFFNTHRNERFSKEVCSICGKEFNTKRI